MRGLENDVANSTTVVPQKQDSRSHFLELANNLSAAGERLQKTLASSAADSLTGLSAETPAAAPALLAAPADAAKRKGGLLPAAAASPAKPPPLPARSNRRSEMHTSEVNRSLRGMSAMTWDSRRAPTRHRPS